MKICQRCKSEYEGNGLKYCGMIGNRTGCAWAIRFEKKRVYNRLSAVRCYRRDPEKFKKRSILQRKSWGLEQKARKANSDKRYRVKFRVSYLARQREYYQKVKDERKQKDREYLSTHRSQIYLRNRARYYRKKAVGSFTPKEWLELKHKYGDVCIKCGEAEPAVKITIDHKVPLAKGGTNTIDNLQPLCLRCNQEKHTGIAFAAVRLSDRTMYLAEWGETLVHCR